MKSHNLLLYFAFHLPAITISLSWLMVNEILLHSHSLEVIQFIKCDFPRKGCERSKETLAGVKNYRNKSKIWNYLLIVCKRSLLTFSLFSLQLELVFMHYCGQGELSGNFEGIKCGRWWIWNQNARRREAKLEWNENSSLQWKENRFWCAIVKTFS